MSNQTKVKAFMLKAEQKVRVHPMMPTASECDLRLSLIKEELGELEEAITNIDLVEVADGLADLLYVIYGAANTFGIDIQEVFDEVHRTNLTKFSVGGYRRSDGKWFKPPDWEPPKIAEILDRQSKL